MNKKKIVLPVIAGLLAVIMIAGIIWEMVYIFTLKNKNNKLENFIETNFDIDIDKWDGRKVALSEADLVDDLSDAIDDALGIYINGNTFEEFAANLLKEFQGEYMEIHEIYDDTAVVEAYKSGDTSNLSEEDLYVLNKATEIIDEIITDDMSDYEKELAVYNWQVKYISYDEEAFSAFPDDIDNYYHKPYGVLKYHTAICVGNATTFKLFMDLLEIDCKIIHSTEEGEHAWNMVCLDDEWYHVDVTFDSGIDGVPVYDYFNVPDSFKENGGYPWDRAEFPEANSLKYTYIVSNAIEFGKIDEVPQLVKDAIDNKQESLILKSEEAMYQVETVVDSISERLNENTWIYVSNIIDTDEGCVYIIDIYNDDYETENEYENEYEYDEGTENIDNIIDEIF